MNKFRYIWREHTFVSQVEGWPSFKVKSWDTIKTELPTKFMLSNQFIMVGQEAEELSRLYSRFVDSEKSKIEMIWSKYKLFCDEFDKQKKAKKADFDLAVEQSEILLKKRKEEYIAKLEELAADEDKDVSVQAKVFLKEIWGTVNKKTKEAEAKMKAEVDAENKKAEEAEAKAKK